MKYDFDTYLLYERNRMVGYTCRIRVTLTEEVDPEVLRPAAAKAFRRYPYYAQSVSVNGEGAYVLSPNDAPITVAPDNGPVRLGGPEANGLLFAITYRGRDIFFNFSHNFCGGCGAMFWIKTTLWQYLTDTGHSIPADGVNLPGTPVTPEEIAAPDADALPREEPPASRKGDSFFAVADDYMEMRQNPAAFGDFYYPIAIQKTELMKYARDNDGSPNSILSALLFQMTRSVFPEAEQISAKIISNYRADVGCPETHRDLVRYLRAVYPPKAKDWPVDRISTVTRGSMFLQMEPEYSWRECRKLYALRRGIDAQDGLEAKKKYAVEHSLLQHQARDSFTVSYVGKIDWGGLGAYIEDVYSITDGHLMMEVNATDDHFCVSFQTIRSDGKHLKAFLRAMDDEGIRYRVGARQPKNLPILDLP